MVVRNHLKWIKFIEKRKEEEDDMYLLNGNPDSDVMPNIAQSLDVSECFVQVLYK